MQNKILKDGFLLNFFFFFVGNLPIFLLSNTLKDSYDI